MCKAISTRNITQYPAHILLRTSHFLVNLIVLQAGAWVKRKGKTNQNICSPTSNFYTLTLSSSASFEYHLFTQNNRGKSKKIGRERWERLGVLPDPKRGTVRLAKEIPYHPTTLWLRPSNCTSETSHLTPESESFNDTVAQPSELPLCGNWQY